ncbi:hypothetical protein ACI797_13605 [Geodermatophilus sp. SYSU D00691]
MREEFATFSVERLGRDLRADGAESEVAPDGALLLHGWDDDAWEPPIRRAVTDDGSREFPRSRTPLLLERRTNSCT